MQDLLTPREAAKALRISERTLYSLTQPRGTIPVVRIGRAVRYSADSLERWVKGRQLAGGQR
ncbi:MAG: helix-turn-helix domain-containing protein [Planctomycetaceae bacterium]|nr:helix-turn-helix domain-containing protein [Planctomycetaceae bacterium]